MAGALPVGSADEATQTSAEVADGPAQEGALAQQQLVDGVMHDASVIDTLEEPVSGQFLNRFQLEFALQERRRR